MDTLTEKVMAMAILGLGSFLAGMLPAIISDQNRRRFPLTTSLLLCFGAGVLLATALVHILPEVRQQMASNLAEISLCAGFFVIYFIDEFIHYYFGETVRHAHNHDEPTIPTMPATSQSTTQTSNRNYGALATEAAPLLRTGNVSVSNHNRNSAATASCTVTTDEHNSQELTHDKTTFIHEHSDTHVHSQGNGQGHGHSHATPCDDDAIVEEANARICHTNHAEPCVTQSMTGTLGLFVALSLHSAIEGLAIGVQNSATKVLFLLGAVSCHKFVMAFCLGLEFRSNPQTSLRSHIIGLLVFALGAVCGIGIGMAIVDVHSGWMTATLPVIQALAGGTLLYVTVCEVMPREKARWHQNPARKTAGFLQFLAVSFGFAGMSIMNYYLDDEN